MTTAAATRLYSDVQLEHICSYWATVTAPEVIGPLTEGVRVNVYVTDGEVSGPKMRGRVRPVGGDWLTLRADGVGVFDVRATIELEDGALIYTTYNGVADLGAGGYDRFLAGNPPAVVPFAHCTALLHCSSRLCVAEPPAMHRSWRGRHAADEGQLRHLCCEMRL